MANKIELPITEIVRLYKAEHLKATELARRYNVSIGTILKHLYNNGIPKIYHNYKHNPNSAHKHTFTETDIKEIIRLYTVEHLSTIDIGKRYGVSFSTIKDRLKENNIQIRHRYYNKYRKTLIKSEEIPSIIKNAQVINTRLTGEVTCPICHKTRRLSSLTRPRIKDIVNSNGKCQPCSHATVLDINTIRPLYIEQKMTTKHIGKLFNVAHITIDNLLKANNIPMRKRGELHKRKIDNKGTLEHPELDDICRGVDIGLNDVTYYRYVECPQCHSRRWQMQSHIKRSPLCRECSLINMGLNHRGENAVGWHGGLSFEPYGMGFSRELKEQIRLRDNYTCQLCGKVEDGIKLTCHHIDYNKRNHHPNNLISLCTAKKGIHPNNHSCHLKTNHNRPYWTEYFTNLLKSKGLYITEYKNSSR